MTTKKTKTESKKNSKRQLDKAKSLFEKKIIENIPKACPLPAKFRVLF